VRGNQRETCHRRTIVGPHRRHWLPVLGAALTLALASVAAADTGWVRGAPLNLRTGAGEEYRIIATVQPGDRLEIVQQGDGWIQVRDEQGRVGWMREGYLEPKPPPTLQVNQLGDEVNKLQAELDAARKQSSELQTRTDTLTSSDSEQREKIERLTRENFRLQAGQRWVEWLTGALILGTGMALGAILASLGRRRQRPRLKL
jgi:SH3 domain protein